MVEGRIDGGAWTPAIPADGAFDDYTEDFSWTSPPLADGVHVAEARAHTSVGNWTVALPSDTITVSGSPVAVQNPGASTGLFALDPSVPSPIRGVGTLRFTLPAAGPARLSIYAVDGSRVRLLLDRALSAGPSSVSWDGRDDRGRHVTAGVYFSRLESGSMSRTRRLAVVH
jgi:hypothetical protein